MNKSSDAGGFLATYGTALAALILFGIFAAAAPNFLNPTNLLNVLKQSAFAILGLEAPRAYRRARSFVRQRVQLRRGGRRRPHPPWYSPRSRSWARRRPGGALNGVSSRR
jgi:hypothetical protein